jgi:L-2-hydroxyglutarate oxidase LhgO
VTTDPQGTHDFCVIGAGIVGLSVARQLLLAHPSSSVLVVDKESTLAAHQTGHNSGVVHAGIYYKPGSAKSVLCRRGVKLLQSFCAEHDIEYEVCGKLIIATDSAEEAALAPLHERATVAGVPGIRIIGSDEIRDREPYAVGRAALFSPTTAIVDYRAVAAAIATEIQILGGQVNLDTRVTAITESADTVSVETTRGSLPARQLVICGGLQSDHLAQLAGGRPDPQIVPFRGEYFRLRADRADLVRGLIYPVPDPRYPFLGTHFTKMIDGGVTVGPNAVLALAREGYRWRDVNRTELRRLASWPGTWRMARKHWRTGGYEITGSLSKRIAVHRARKYVPSLGTDDLVRAGAGVRAQAVDRQGGLLDDFAFGRSTRVLAVRNAPSPAATAALAIAEHIVRELTSD